MFTAKKSLTSFALATMLAVGFASAVVLTSLHPAAAASSSSGGTGILALGGNLGQVSNLDGYSIVIGDPSDATTLAGLPGKALAYFAGTDVNTQWSTGVPYAQAAANGWLLKDSAGNLLVNRAYASNYIGDVGSAAYQQAWVTNVLTYLNAHPGVDGIFIDDVLYDLKPMTGVEAALYPTQQAWAAAQLSFVAAVGSALRSKGYYVLANACGYVPGDPNSDNGNNTVTWWQELGPYVSGLMNEYYDQLSDGSYSLRPSGTSWTQNWDGWQRMVQTAQSMGRDFVGVIYGSAVDTHAMVYGKASFLLDWNGGGSAFVFSTTNGANPTNTAWTSGIGLPAAAKRQIGVGWMRMYSGGVALVNPSASSSQTFQLGTSYLTASGATVTSITLAPTTGMILSATAPATTTSGTTTGTTTTDTTTTGTTTTAAATTPTTTTTTTTTTKSSGGNGKPHKH